MIKDNSINFDGHTLIKVLQGASTTVGDVVAVQSPTGLSSGVSPTTTFNTRRAAVGGAIYAGFSDIAGVLVDDLHIKLQPGDVVACSAVASSTITVTVTPAGGVAETVALIPATAVGGVLLFWS